MQEARASERNPGTAALSSSFPQVSGMSAIQYKAGKSSIYELRHSRIPSSTSRPSPFRKLLQHNAMQACPDELRASECAPFIQKKPSVLKVRLSSDLSCVISLMLLILMPSTRAVAAWIACASLHARWQDMTQPRSCRLADQEAARSFKKIPECFSVLPARLQNASDIFRLFIGLSPDQVPSLAVDLQSFLLIVCCGLDEALKIRIRVHYLRKSKSQR